MSMKKNHYIIILFVCFFGCAKSVEVGPPKTQLISQTVFSSDATAQAAMVGAYAYLSPNYFNYIDYLTVTSEFAADNASYTAGDATYDAFTSNSLNPFNGALSVLWSVPYQTIYACNAIIENVNSSSNLTSSTKNQLIGEASFLRGFSYFYLVNLFGEVPLVLTTDVNKNSLLPQATRSNIYAQIIMDLTTAYEKLSLNSGGQNIRATPWAAAAMLARVYLYAGDWVHSEAMASAVISSGNFTLETDLTQVFVASSREVIFQYSTQQGYTFLGSYFIPQTLPSIPTLILTDDLVNAFDPADLRKSSWTMSTVSDGINYSYPYKYKQSLPDPPSGPENYVTLRLAEQYLIRAEDRARQNNISGAADDLDSVRQRAGLPSTTATDLNSMLDAIEKERRLELFYEWGDRWLNLKRTGRVNTIIGSYKPAEWKATDSLYPVPQLQISANPNLVQNKGY
jgi:starch-binding outer membrane protein, SusD/RagB family